MPELPEEKVRPHPWHAAGKPSVDTAAPRPQRCAPTKRVQYAELQLTSNFTFLTGASHPDELVRRAAELDYAAVAITDRNSLAGIVRAHVAAKETGIPLLIGCTLVFSEPEDFCMLVYPTDRASYGRLCRLLSVGKRRAEKGQCRLRLHDLIEHNNGLLAVVLAASMLNQDFIDQVMALKSFFGNDRLSIAASCLYGPDDRGHLARLAALSTHVGVPMVATNDVHYHLSQRRYLQDVLTCIRLGCTLDRAGLQLFANGQRYLKPPQEMARLFADYPHAITRTAAIAQRACAFNLDQLRYQYPDEVHPPDQTPMQHLTQLSWRGAGQRYPQGVPDRVRRIIEHELHLIDELNYAPYFLTVYDLVKFARGRNILCQGRGAAANSAICYCLDITAVDPDRIDLLFERFVSRERNEPPDIDIDFEHERREEVIQYIYQKYSRDRAALTAEVITYRPRSAVRDVGKALGLSLDCVDRLAKNIDGWSEALPDEQLRAGGLNPADPTSKRLIALVDELLGFPRHLSQHVGGFVITRDPLCELVPIENAAMKDRAVIEWDKDDIDAMHILKVDVLGLGMLTCIRKGFELVELHHGRALSLATVPPEDPVVYDMICKADTIGVFQIESRAQMSMLPRLRPRCYYDLVIEVAIVRPGPIQGDMVHPYLRRRDGQEPVSYPNETVKQVLGKTLGVPLFQEQAMALAIVAAGFTPGEADQLRRAIAAWKSKKTVIFTFGQRLIEGMTANGYPREFAERCFKQIQGFSEYGFPESHAASFALLVYVSAWLKYHYPAVFAAALINSQPMGFYAPAQIVRDAQEHGACVQPIDVNFSEWDCKLEEKGTALRLGMRLVKGLRQDEALAVVKAVSQHGRFASIETLWRTVDIRRESLRNLASADAFASMGLDRQAALWQIHALRDQPMPLFDVARQRDTAETPATLPQVSQQRKMYQDYASVGLSLRAHPLSFMRTRLQAQGVVPAAALKDESKCPNGLQAAIAGLVLVRQRPGTASGIVFMTIEDETGIANLIVRPGIFQRYRQAARHGKIIVARGRIERQGQVVHLQVGDIERIDRPRQTLSKSRDFH